MKINEKFIMYNFNDRKRYEWKEIIVIYCNFFIDFYIVKTNKKDKLFSTISLMFDLIKLRSNQNGLEASA